MGEVVDEKREKDGSLRNTLLDSKERLFSLTGTLLKHYASVRVRKKKIKFIDKARREANQNIFVEESGMPVRAESQGKIDSGKDRPRARLGLVEPLRMGGNKMKNVI